MNKVKKKCTKCDIEKDISEFCKHKGRKDGINNWCKECEKIRVAKWKEINPEKKKQSDKNYYWKNRNKKLKEHKEYYQENKEYIRNRVKNYYQNNQEKIIRNVKKYRQTPKGKIVHNNSNSKRRSKCRKSDISSIWLLKLKKNTEVCELCSVELTDAFGENQYNLDHIISLNCGGTHIMENVRYICRKCNITRPKTI